MLLRSWAAGHTSPRILQILFEAQIEQAASRGKEVNILADFPAPGPKDQPTIL
jgi:hypothetical protein